ncbi:MAG: efflux RND transporter periplasmic adaptor subunit [Betaproteobacteria bacterium]|nr:efflux RND transporter periplasmic adaptor subunit [Betaproteobacteria bacterium]
MSKIFNNLIILLSLTCSSILFAQINRTNSGEIIKEVGKTTPQSIATPDKSSIQVIRGLVLSQTETILSSQMNGKITAIPFGLGQQFAIGSSLVVFDCDENNAKLKVAESDVQGAQFFYESRIRLQGLQSVSELEVAQAAIALNKSKAQLDFAKTQVNYCKVTAPINGRVVRQKVKVFENVNTGQPILEIVDPKKLKIIFNVPSNLIKQIEKNRGILIFVDELQREFLASIKSINGRIDAVGQTLEVEASFTNDVTNLITPGMAGNITLLTPEQELKIKAETLAKKQAEEAATLKAQEEAKQVKAEALAKKQAEEAAALKAQEEEKKRIKAEALAKKKEEEAAALKARQQEVEKIKADLKIANEESQKAKKSMFAKEVISQKTEEEILFLKRKQRIEKKQLDELQILKSQSDSKEILLNNKLNDNKVLLNRKQDENKIKKQAHDNEIQTIDSKVKKITESINLLKAKKLELIEIQKEAEKATNDALARSRTENNLFNIAKGNEVEMTLQFNKLKQGEKKQDNNSLIRAQALVYQAQDKTIQAKTAFNIAKENEKKKIEEEKATSQQVEKVLQLIAQEEVKKNRIEEKKSIKNDIFLKQQVDELNTLNFLKAQESTLNKSKDSLTKIRNAEFTTLELSMKNFDQTNEQLRFKEENLKKLQEEAIRARKEFNIKSSVELQKKTQLDGIENGKKKLSADDKEKKIGAKNDSIIKEPLNLQEE